MLPKDDLKKKVSFASTQTLFFSAQYLTSEDRKNLCWFSNADLEHSRAEVREAIRLMQEMEGNIEAVNKVHDVCLRGVEKYADAVGKYRNQRLFIESVLQQHSSRSDAETLAALSRYMSQKSTTIALFYASKCAEELQRIYLLEEAEREEEEKSSGDASSTSSWIEVTCPKLKELECTSAPSAKKRSRSPCFDEITLHASRKIQCCE